MRTLAKGRVSRAALFGILFFAVGCGSKDEEAPPNYVVREVQTGTMTENPPGKEEASADSDQKRAPVGNSSIIREEVGEAAGKWDGSVQAPSADEGKEPSGTDSAQAPSADGGKEPSGMDSTQAPTAVGAGEPSVADPDKTLSDEGRTELSGLVPDQALPGGEAEEINLLPAGTVVDVSAFSEEELLACFYFEEVPDEVFRRMEGNSYGEDCTVELSQLRYVRVLHYGFDGEVRIGELVVNQAVAQDICDIFKELFDAQYPIEKMVLVDAYGGDDDASMADNNTSCFNFRVVEGTTSLSKHAYGLAVDVNPLYNPYIPVRDGLPSVMPENAGDYVDRGAACDYYIQHGDVCYEAFARRGFTWGGDWASGKDYQHFSKTIE